MKYFLKILKYLPYLTHGESIALQLNILRKVMKPLLMIPIHDRHIYHLQ